MLKDVYVVEKWEPHECSEIVGVFADKEDALEAGKTYVNPDRCCWAITRYPLNKRFHGQVIFRS